MQIIAVIDFKFFVKMNKLLNQIFQFKGKKFCCYLNLNAFDLKLKIYIYYLLKIRSFNELNICKFHPSSLPRCTTNRFPSGLFK